MTASRVAWFVLAPFCVLLAVLAVVVIVRESARSVEPPSAPAAADVVMERLVFTPGTLTVARGTEVLFDNNDVAPHTVTADEGSTDSGIIEAGKAFKLVVNEPFAYHCTIHPSMTAEIRMEG